MKYNKTHIKCKLTHLQNTNKTHIKFKYNTNTYANTRQIQYNTYTIICNAMQIQERKCENKTHTKCK